MGTRIDWSVSHFSVTNIKWSYDVEKWQKRCFLRFKTAYQSSLRITHHVKEAESILHLFQLGQESCDSLAKNNFVRAIFQTFGTLCDCVRKNAGASRNCCIIYLKSKHLCEHCIYNESWLNNKIEKVRCLFVPLFYCCCW